MLTTEQIEKDFETGQRILAAYEELIKAQSAPYDIHMDRLKALGWLLGRLQVLRELETSPEGEVMPPEKTSVDLGPDYPQ
jgi:hypothetical protein